MQTLFILSCCIVESTPKTHTIKKVSFGDIFFPQLAYAQASPSRSRYGRARHHRVSKNENLIQNNQFYEICQFSEWTQCLKLSSLILGKTAIILGSDGSSYS